MPALLAAAFAGWLGAVWFGDITWLQDFTQLIHSAFLSALKMIIAPLIFFSLISGVLQLRAATSVGRLGLVTLCYYTLTSAIAIAIGLTIVFWLHPWTAYPPLQVLPEVSFKLIDAEQGSLLALLTGMVKSMLVNPFNALAETNILGILCSALLLGLAAAYTLPTDSKWPGLINEITQTIYRIARWVIATLPIGLFAIAFQLTGKVDITTLISLGYFASVVVGATLFHGLIILPGIAWLGAGVAPWQFLQQASQAMFTAFVTSSSAATLPVSIATAEDKLGVDAGKAAFVLPLGATVNMDGTALFEGIAVVFLAYMFNVPLDGTTLVVVFLVAMLASAGAPGIPSGSMAGLQTVLLAVGIPLEAIALILLIERPLDTVRTAVNVEGDLVGALIAQRWTQ